MPIARFEMPDGRVARFEVPAGLSPEDAQNLISSSFVNKQPDAPLERTWGEVAKDVGVTTAKGIIGLPQAAAGILDIPTLGYASKGLESLGVRFADAQKILDQEYSPAQQEAFKKVEAAEGFVPSLKAMVQNPSVPAHMIGRSIPQMLGGAGIAKGLTKLIPSVGGAVAGGVGEGVLGAGSAAAQTREENPEGILTPKQSLAALGSGVGTAAFGVLGGKLAQRLGLDDIDTMLARGGPQAELAGQAKSGFTKSVIGSGISEGAFEELPQSVQEQMWQNWATDKPLDEGLGKAAATGLLTGSVAGGVAGGYGNLTREAPPPVQATQPSPAAPEAPQIDPDKYRSAIEQLRANIPEAGISDAQKIADIFKTAGIQDETEISSYVKQATDNGDIKAHISPFFDVKDANGATLFRTTEQAIADKAAERLNAEEPNKASVAPIEITTLRNNAGYPPGYDIKQGRFKQQEFDIVSGDIVLSPKPMTMDDVDQKAQRLAEIRKDGIKGIDKEVKGLQEKVSQNNLSVESMEAEGQANTPEYATLSQQVVQDNLAIQKSIEELTAKKTSFTAPLLVRPAKASDEGFTVFQNGKPLYYFPTLEQAEETVDAAPTSVPTQEAIAAKEALRQTLLPFMKQVGLEGTGLRIMDSIESAQGSGDGYYAQNLIAIALSAPNPMATLRHETIHALKELGAFTDQEWKLLESTAKKDWINRFIKNRNTQDGKSLYEAYKAIYLQDKGSLEGFDSYITEEAIADAFKYFNANGTPPGMLSQIFAKIKAFLESLGNQFSGLGFQTADQVFKRVDMGQMRPTRAAPEGNAPRYQMTDETKIKSGMNAPLISGTDIDEALDGYLDPKAEALREDYVQNNKGMVKWMNAAKADDGYQDALQQNLKRLGFPEVFIGYRGHPSDTPSPASYANVTTDRKYAESFKGAYVNYPSDLKWVVDELKVRREDVLALGHTDENELIVNLRPDALIKDNKKLKERAGTGEAPRFSLNIDDSGDKRPFDLKGVRIYEKELEDIVKNIGNRIAGLTSGKTLADVRAGVKKLQQYADDGIQGAEWYEKSAKAVLDVFNQDRVLAEKFFQIIAITSAATEVKANFTMTYNAWKQAAEGKPIKVATEEKNKKISDLLNFGIDWEGRKTNTFYLNLMEAMEGKDSGRSTIDLHMTRMLFDRDAPTDAQYELAEKMVRLLASKVNVPPRQIQAASWVTQKAKGLFKQFRAKGQHKKKNDEQLRFLCFERALGDYAYSFKAKGVTSLPSTAALREPSPEIRARTEVITGEAIPSTKGEMVQISEMVFKEKLEFNKQVIKEKVVEQIADILGLKSKIRASEGTGGYASAVSPNMIVRIVNFNPKVAKADAQILSDAMSYVFQQDATPFFRADPNATGQLGYRIQFKPANLTITQEKKLFKALQEELGTEAGYSKIKGNEFILINYRGDDGKPFLMDDASFEVALVKFRDKAQDIVGVENSSAFGAESEYRYYDWENEATGKTLVKSIQNGRPDRPDISTGLDSLRKSFVDAARTAVEKTGVKPRFQLTEAEQPEIKARINVDGVMRPTRNNKGSLIAATPEGIQNFWRWFGNSGVVDSKGYPRLVLHGTARDFETFTPKQAGAIFFTDDPKFADTYSKQLSPNWMVDHFRDFLSDEQIESAKAETLRVMDNLTREEYRLTQKSSPEEFMEIYEWELAVKSRLPSGPNTMPIYVKMDNPFDYENKAHVEKVVDKLLGSSKSIKFKDDVRALPPNPLNRDDLIRIIHGDKSKEGKAARGGFWPLIENNQVVKAIQSLDFDGLSMWEDGVKNYAVFKPTQVKSAVGNLGTFDEKNPNIRYSISSPNTPEFKRWFGDSKVVDGDGKPLVAYHGTTSSFNVFETKQVQLGKPRRKTNAGELGSWFAAPSITEYDEGNAEYIASSFTEDTSPSAGLDDYKTGANVMPVYLSIKKPYDAGDYESLMDDRDEYGSWKALRKHLEGEGYDGIVIYGSDTDGNVIRDDWVAFNPAQIKSAIGNRGTFNENNPDIRYSLRDAFDADFNATFGTAGNDALNRATYVRQEKGFAQRIAEAISPDSVTAIRQKLLNKYEAVERLSKMVAADTRPGFLGAKELLADVSANAAALQADRAAGVAAEALMNGIPVYEKGYTKVTDMGGKVKGLIPILEPLLKKYQHPKILQMFQFYSATRRGIRLYNEGREHVLTPADFALGKAFETKYPEFKTAYDEYQKFNEGLVKFLIDTGVLSKAMGAEWTKYGDYIPFYRQIDGKTTVGPKMFQNLSGVKITPELTGGDKQIGDYLETVVRNTRSAIEQGMKNVAAQRIVRDIMRLNTQGMNDMGRKLQPHEKSGSDVVTVRENGDDVRYQVIDPLLVESMKSLHNMGINSFWTLMSYPTQLLRNLVTKEPSFILANLARDSMQAWVTSGVSMTPLVDTFKQFGKVLANQSPEAKALRAAGIGTGYEFSGDIKSSAKAVADALNDRAGIKTGWQKAMWPVSKVWDALDKGSNASDLATRAEIYKKVLAETGNEAEAIYQSLEVMNFGRMGSSPMIQVISALVPFFNARVQGMDVLYRAGFGRMATQNSKAQHKAFMYRALFIAAMSSLYWFMARDTDEWKRASKEVRDNYWLIGNVKIPIPFEIGVLFKVAPERILETAFGNDTGGDLAESALRNIVSTLKINPVPQAFLPILEQTIGEGGFSLFTMMPIVGRGMENVAAPYQRNTSTTELSIMLGEQLNLSPIRIDHVISAYTGSMGMYMAQMIGGVINTVSGSEETRPAMSIEQTPVLKRFFASDKAGGTIDAFYSLKKEVDVMVRTQHELQSRGNPEQYAEYMEKNGQLLGLKGYTLSLNDALPIDRKSVV